MAFRLGNATENSVRVKCNDALVDAIDFGSTNTSGRILIYSGTQPANPQTAASGTLLVTIPFGNPAYANTDSTAAADLAGGSAISATITTSGTAGWLRVVDRDENAIFDASVSDSGADVNFDSVSFVSGGTATISSLVIQSPM